MHCERIVYYMQTSGFCRTEITEIISTIHFLQTGNMHYVIFDPEKKFQSKINELLIVIVRKCTDTIV